LLHVYFILFVVGENPFELRFQFISAVAARTTIDYPSGGVDDDGCWEGRDIETAGYTCSIAMQLTDKRPVHVEFFG
jgi:hypothetical protein